MDKNIELLIDILPNNTDDIIIIKAITTKV